MHQFQTEGSGLGHQADAIFKSLPKLISPLDDLTRQSFAMDDDTYWGIYIEETPRVAMIWCIFIVIATTLLIYTTMSRLMSRNLSGPLYFLCISLCIIHLLMTESHDSILPDFRLRLQIRVGANLLNSNLPSIVRFVRKNIFNLAHNTQQSHTVSCSRLLSKPRRPCATAAALRGKSHMS